MSQLNPETAVVVVNGATTVTNVINDEVRYRAVKLVQLKAKLDACKPLYEEVDRLTLQLNSMTPGPVFVTLTEEERTFLHAGELHHVAPDQVVTVVDNFATKNTAFKTAGVKRFEAETMSSLEFKDKQEKAAKKRAKQLAE